MTTVTEVRSASKRLFAGTWHSTGECYYNTLLCWDYFSSSSAVSRAFSVLCVYSTFGHHPHPLGYLCAKFRFFRDLHCWDSPWRKITYSITHSLNHSPSLFDSPGTEARALWNTRTVIAQQSTQESSAYTRFKHQTHNHKILYVQQTTHNGDSTTYYIILHCIYESISPSGDHKMQTSVLCPSRSDEQYDWSVSGWLGCQCCITD